MTALNIDKRDNTNETVDPWQIAVGDEPPKTANIETVETEVPSGNPKLFDLARSISYRANSHRQFSRSSSII